VRAWIAGVGAKTAFIERASPLGKRLLRKLQWQAARRTAERRDLLHATRGSGADRGLATPKNGAPTTPCSHGRRQPCLPGNTGRSRRRPCR
jgi:hypothetical protein